MPPSPMARTTLQNTQLVLLTASMNTRGSSPSFTTLITTKTLCSCFSKIEIGPKITSGLSSNSLNFLQDPIRFFRCFICGGT
ncbi:hypothetical protein IMY05_002G0080000 [Salix suchowensis]|nr:hypothetical protein IMY05_002G0080000 [Salix suchowensis]